MNHLTGADDGYTIDVGPVSCPACHRPYDNVRAERDALVEALKEIADRTDQFGKAPHYETHSIARNALASVEDNDG